MRFDVLTIFPDSIRPYLETSILGKAATKGHIDPHLWDVRDFATDKHKTVDDTPYGGGAGMVMKIEPIDRALEEIEKDASSIKPSKRKIVVMSARGERFTQRKAEEYADLDQLILISGRYEGIDQRVADHLADEELSIGDYVLAGGELPSLVVLETVSRLIPGVLGNIESLSEESHSTEGAVEYPQYTKPEEYKGWSVPEVLLTGDHERIKKWRDSN